MKKITALVLALVMTLSLLPMNVWAAGESGSGQPLYWNYDPQNPQWRTGRFYEEFGGSSWLDLATDNNGTPLASDWTVFASPTDLGSVSKAQDGRLCWDRSMVRNPVSGEIVVTSGTMTYAIPAQVGEPSISVYSTKPIGDGSVATYTDVQYADFDNSYVYTSGNNAKIYLVAKYDDMKFAGTSGIEESWVSIAGDGKSITITIPRDVSGQQEFQVLCNWVDGGGNVVRTDNRYFRFRDTNDTCDLFSRMLWDNGSIVDSWGFGRLFAQAGEQMIVEFALPPENASQPDAVMSLEGATVTASDNLGEARINGNRVYWDGTTLIPGTTGSLKITKDGTTYNIPVMVTPPLVGVYSDAPNYDNLGTYYLTFDENRCYTYESGASEPQVFYLLARDGATFRTLPDLLPEGFAIVENSGDRLATYTIPADSYGRRDIVIQVVQNWEEGGEQKSEEIEWWVGFDQEKLEGDAVPNDKLTNDNSPYGMVPIGETGYYMAPIFYLYGKMDAMIYDTQWFAEGSQLEAGIAVGFWKKIEGSEVLELVSGAEAAEFAKKFNNTLKFDIRLVANAVNDTQFPYIRDISPSNDAEFYEALNGYPLAQIYLFNRSSQGVWCFEISGTYTDGDTEIPVVAYGRTEKREVPNIPLEIDGELTIENINAALAAFVEPEGLYNLEVPLPEGELNGYIVVPENLDSVGFFGRMDRDHNILTTLKGGFEANNADLRVQGVRFEGAGVGREKNEKIPEKYGDRPNKAIYGTASGAVYHCSFTGYDCAIEMTGGVIGSGALTEGIYPVEGTGTFFYDNTVGVMINIPKGDFSGQGDPKFWRTVMLDNDTDIYYKQSGNRLDYELDVSRSIFLRNDNKNSIHNTCGRTLFMPLNTFYNTKSDSNNGNNDPKVDGNVSVAPYYTLSEEGKAALIDNFNAVEMLRNPSYYEEWVTDTRVFPRNWVCPANPDKDLYSVGSENITEDEMTIDIIDNYNDDAYVGTIKLKKDK